MFGKLLNSVIPGQLVIQFTDYCNATCPQCGMRKTNPFTRTKLGSEVVYKLLAAAAKRGLKIISFTGGEPFMFLDELIDYILAAEKVGIQHIRTGTNGFIFRDWKKPGYEEKIKVIAKRLSKTSLRNFWISLDSCIPQIHEEMRGLPDVVEGIRRALPIFHAHGIYPSVNLGLNRQIAGDNTYTLTEAAYDNRAAYLRAFERTYTNAIGRYFEFVIDLGFTMSSICFPMSAEDDSDDTLTPIYQAASSDWVVNYCQDEKAVMFKALLKVVPRYRHRIRHFTPLTSLFALQKKYEQAQKPFPCLGGIRYFFASTQDAHIYPCGYREKDDMGLLDDPAWKQESWQSNCDQCDWECFRDPSELMGPFIYALRHPWWPFAPAMRDREYRQYWYSDIMYYLRNNLFHGRKPFATIA